MTNAASGSLEHEGNRALELMVEALEIIDRCDAALDVGAHLDLAICRLRDLLAAQAAEKSDAGDSTQH
jgi:hypothetical protein